MHTVAQDGFAYYSGWVGKGDDKLSKHLSQNESLPTSEVPSFEGFDCSPWLDMINRAWTGTYFIYSFQNFWQKYVQPQVNEH